MYVLNGTANEVVNLPASLPCRVFVEKSPGDGRFRVIADVDGRLRYTLGTYESDRHALRIVRHVANSADADVIELPELEHCDPDDVAEAVAADGWDVSNTPCPKCEDDITETRDANAGVECRCLRCGHSWRAAASLNQSKPDKG